MISAEYGGRRAELLGNSYIMLSELFERLEIDGRPGRGCAASCTGGLIHCEALEDDVLLTIGAPEAEAQGLLTVETADLSYGIRVLVTGKPEAEADGTVIASTDGAYLPNDARATSCVLYGEAKAAFVESLAAFEGGGDPDTARQYLVMDIGLDNVEAGDYARGFVVQAALPAYIRGTDYHLYHIHADATGKSAITEIDSLAVSEEAFTFTTPDFSTFILKYTVDFTFGELEFHMAGGSSVLLSELSAALKLEIDISNVEDVYFSNPELLSIKMLEADWRLTALQPFSTQEILTLAMSDGAFVVIRVTDAQHILDLTKVITDAQLYLEGEKLDWMKPLLLRESKYYDLRLTFKENSSYQFVDTDEWMTYPLPDGLDLGLDNFERTFTMTVDDARLENNILRYDATLRVFFIKWNTEDTLGFNKLKASNSAEFRIDLQVQFTFNPDKIDFGNDVVREVIRDTSSEVTISKTGVYDKDNDRVDYTVSVISYGNSKDVEVRDVLFGTALTFIDDGTACHGVAWETDRPGGNGTIAADPDNASANLVTLETYTDADIAGENTENTAHLENKPKGFSLVVGDMADGEKIDFHYSALVNYDVLVNGSGKGDYAETFNKVTATANGETVEDDFAFEGDLRYVELQKSRAPVNWGGGETATVNWTVRVNNKPKVGFANVVENVPAGATYTSAYGVVSGTAAAAITGKASD